MTKTAFISGITGQDGAYLAQLLLAKGYRVVGGMRRSSSLNLARLSALGIAGEVELITFDLQELSNIMRVLEQVAPDEIYNLGAQTFVQVSFEQPLYTGQVSGMGVVRLLEALRTLKSEARFYQASTSEMFGKVQQIPQSEQTPFYPRSPYGISKLYAHWSVVNYREAFGLHASSGILFNHESPLRGMEFVTRKITAQLAQIAAGKELVLELGNLEAKRDWGFAGDYVKAMWAMVQQDEADDYVVATGVAHSVREFVEVAAKALDFDLIWQGAGVDQTAIDKKTGKQLVAVNPNFFRPTEVDILVGDATKAKEKLKWQAETGFNELVEMMTVSDFDRAGKEQNWF